MCSSCPVIGAAGRGFREQRVTTTENTPERKRCTGCAGHNALVRNREVSRQAKKQSGFLHAFLELVGRQGNAGVVINCNALTSHFPTLKVQSKARITKCWCQICRSQGHTARLCSWQRAGLIRASQTCEITQQHKHRRDSVAGARVEVERDVGRKVWVGESRSDSNASAEAAAAAIFVSLCF